ncbi:MAG TPA: hypothetical protein VG944_06375, partial [Fimbriimonas sp.]|nr:hypothetical protein [Fimbriimonas sp.]
ALWRSTRGSMAAKDHNTKGVAAKFCDRSVTGQHEFIAKGGVQTRSPIEEFQATQQRYQRLQNPRAGAR